MTNKELVTRVGLIERDLSRITAALNDQQNRISCVINEDLKGLLEGFIEQAEEREQLLQAWCDAAQPEGLQKGYTPEELWKVHVKLKETVDSCMDSGCSGVCSECSDEEEQ